MTPQELKIEMFIAAQANQEARASEIAKRLGVSRSLVYMVRDGKATSYSVACEIARCIGRSVDEAFPGKYSHRIDECPDHSACR